MEPCGGCFSSHLPHPSIKQCKFKKKGVPSAFKKNPIRSQFTVPAVSDPSSSCLKGGAPNDKRKLTNCVSSNELQLINRGTDCFVNSVVQLIRNTAYAPFIRAHIPMLIADSAEDSYKLSKRLSYVYSVNSVGQPKSTAFIRTHVRHMSGKHNRMLRNS